MSTYEWSVSYQQWTAVSMLSVWSISKDGRDTQTATHKRANLCLVKRFKVLHEDNSSRWTLVFFCAIACMGATLHITADQLSLSGVVPDLLDSLLLGITFSKILKRCKSICASPGLFFFFTNFNHLMFCTFGIRPANFLVTAERRCLRLGKLVPKTTNRCKSNTV